MGALKNRINKERKKHPNYYASRSCNPTEQNLNSFVEECSAVVWATNLFRPCLFGKSFTLVTDHESFKWIMSTQKLTSKLVRCSFLLQEENLTVVHRVGTDNVNAECLSRYPRTSTDNPPVFNWKRGYILPPATCLAILAQPEQAELCKLLRNQERRKRRFWTTWTFFDSFGRINTGKALARSIRIGP